MEGARIATALGATASLIIMMVHFLKESNTLRFSFKKTISVIFYRLLKVDLNGYYCYCYGCINYFNESTNYEVFK